MQEIESFALRQVIVSTGQNAFGLLTFPRRLTALAFCSTCRTAMGITPSLLEPSPPWPAFHIVR